MDAVVVVLGVMTRDRKGARPWPCSMSATRSVLVNRGAWRPFCQTQLSAFQRVKDDLARAGIRVVSFSVDDEETARKLAEERCLTFDLGHSADADAVADALGAFVHDEPHYLQSTGFVLDPQGRVVVSSTPAAPSAGWFRRTSSASCATRQQHTEP